MTNPCPHARSAASVLEQMRAKWEAAGRGAADERAPLLANWYLGNRHAWWEAMEMVKAAEPTRPAVTREAVMRALVSCGAAECSREYENCSRGVQCTCKIRIDAIMALIEERRTLQTTICAAMLSYLASHDPTGALPDDTAVIETIDNTGGPGVVITAGMIRAAAGEGA